MTNTVVYVPSDSGHSVWFLGGKFTFLATGAETDGRYSTMHIVMEPESGPPPHSHPASDEQFYVLEGSLHFQIFDREFQAKKGDFVHIPRGTVHSFKSEPGRRSTVLVTFSPSGTEGLFSMLGEPYVEGSAAPPITQEFIARLAAVEADYDHVTVPGP